MLTQSCENPTVMSPEISEFRAHAYQAAVRKARELAGRSKSQLRRGGLSLC